MPRLDYAGVRERHRKITEKHGAPSADNVFRVLRAVYNRGLREHPEDWHMMQPVWLEDLDPGRGAAAVVGEAGP